MVKLRIKIEQARSIMILSIVFFVIVPCIPLAIHRLYAQDKIVAIVNSEVITQKDLDDFVNFTRLQLSARYKGKELESKIQTMKLDLLDKLIEDRLILQEAKEAKITVDGNRIKQRINEIKKDYRTEAEFQGALAKQGISQADIETKIREQLLMYSIIDDRIRKKILVRPSEVTDFFQNNPAQFQVPEQREFVVLAIESKDLADVIYKDIKSSPGNLELIAKKYSLSINKMSAKKSGELRKDLEDVVFKLAPGEAASPISIDNSYYIVRLDKVIPPRNESLTEVQEHIYDFLFEKKMQEALSNWLNEIKKRSYIKIL